MDTAATERTESVTAPTGPSPAAHRLFSFPDPVNELAARTVAAGVLAMAATALAAGLPWMLVPLTYGFWARVLTGPTLSPLGQLATRVVAPRLGPPRPTPGPPKRFAQAIGATLTTVASVVCLTAGWEWARWLVALLVVAAGLEAAFGLCLGCRAFALLVRTGILRSAACEDCADLSRRAPIAGH
jgi:hypothetical protein